MEKGQNKEESTICDPQSPPNLQFVHASAEPQLPSNHQIIQSIISSNEQLIGQQGTAIKKLQLNNYEQKQQIKRLSEKYEALLHIVSQSAKSIQKAQSDGGKNSAGLLVEDCKVSISDMVEKIRELEQQLSKTKVELALKSQQLLSFSLKKNKGVEKSPSINAQEFGEWNKNTLGKYFELQPYENFSLEQDTYAVENKELVELWRKPLQSYSGQFRLDKFKEKTQSLIKKYIPKELRGKVWPVLLENKLGMTNCLYIHLLGRREKGWVCEKVRKQIDKDIKRSFYGKTQYETKTGLIMEVCQFLEIFHVFRPDVSYIQGMTYPAIILIPVVGKIKAFNIFCNLILGNSFFRKVYSMEEGFVETVCRSLELLLADMYPAIAKKLQKAAVEAEIYMIQWLFTVFSRGLSFETTLKLWDQLLYHEELAIFRISLSIFEQLGPRLLQSDYEEIIDVIRNFGDHLHEQQLLQSLSQNKLSKDKLHRTIEKVIKSK